MRDLPRGQPAGEQGEERMKISDIMKKSFVSLSSDETLISAAKTLVSEGLSEAPVLNKRKFVGMFRTSDLAATLVKPGIFGAPKQADTNKAKNELVGKHTRNMRTWLHPEADLISALLLLIHTNVNSMPVLDSEGRVIGVVHASELRKEMLKILSSGGKMPIRERKAAAALMHGKPAETPQSAPPARPETHTAIDNLVHFVQDKGSVSAADAAKHCDLTIEEVEAYALSLEKNGLLKLGYDIMGKMKLERPREEE